SREAYLDIYKLLKFLGAGLGLVNQRFFKNGFFKNGFFKNGVFKNIKYSRDITFSKNYVRILAK
ncbi:MAG: hypothetical protein LBE27_04010, partial [Deltaproteobacteria bacterium]|nr:hypothetical protein [Deltaproteobacteria bacterium]